MAFATDGTNTVAFNISSGQTSWSHPWSIIEATYGGGVSVFDSQGNVVQLDPLGNAGTPSCIPCGAPRSLNLWTVYTSLVGLIS